MIYRKNPFRLKKILIHTILLIFILLNLSPIDLTAENENMYGGDQLLRIADDTLSMRLSMEPYYLNSSGTVLADWSVIAASGFNGRYNEKVDFSAYLSLVEEHVRSCYKTPEKLSAAKSTEWHRISLAVLSAGGNPQKIHSDNGYIDLICDGAYNRGLESSLGRQGINGWIWGLICLDSMRYEIPETAYYSRDDIITQILKRQLEDGGFALSGQVSDPDITAMAVQALSVYYNSEKIYTYVSATGGKVSKTVRQTVEECVECLSLLQLDNGGYKSWGTENCESTAQTIIALCCLGIDITSDSRFIKNGNTLLNALMQYRNNDGCFIHSYTYDKNNPTALPNKSNVMATDQALCALAAVYRLENNLRSLYDYRAAQSEELKEHIAAVRRKIASLPESPRETEVIEILKMYFEISEDERNYVYNYSVLSKSAYNKKIDISAIEKKAAVVYNNTNNKDEPADNKITDIDRGRIKELLLLDADTQNYAEIITLYNKVNKTGSEKDISLYSDALKNKKVEIENLMENIDILIQQINSELCPLDSVSYADKNLVNELLKKYNNLSGYDKQKIINSEELLKAKAKVDGIARAAVLFTVLSVCLCIAAAFFVMRIIKRRKQKNNMEI